MAKGKALGNNAIFKENPVLSEDEVAAIRATQSDVDLFTTATFKVRKTYLKKLRDYAFTNRLELKEALDEIMGSFLDKVKDEDLLEYPEKIKRGRRRKSDNG